MATQFENGLTLSQLAERNAELVTEVEKLRAERDVSLNAERVWEKTMMEVCGEDSPASVASEIRALRALRDTAMQALKSQVEQLAAENVGLNSFIVDACWIVDDGQYCDATDFMPETPATDAYLAGIKAEVLPANIAEIIDSGDLETICWQHEHYKAEDYRLALYRFRTDREGAANE